LLSLRRLDPADPTTPKEEAMTITQRITPCLWFDGQAEEAATFYVSVFNNSRITGVTHNGDAGPGPKGSVLVVGFELDGQAFTALNGGPAFKFNVAVSLIINCETQDEVDAYWEKLTSGCGSPSQCGWLKDRFGLSWQVVPTALIDMLQDKDAQKAQRVMQAMLQMTKIDIARLNAAYAG
jgi:predicted 3-demethylubiquinone-9 3-methyltransferase (glyoxalase superfamily)